MAVFNQFQLPISFAQYQEVNKKLNPDQKLPPGCLYHVVTEQSDSITITNVWENEAQADAFFKQAAEVSGIPMQQMDYKQVKELIG